MSLKIILGIQKFKNLETQKKECKKQVNFNELSKLEISKIKNTKLTT